MPANGVEDGGPAAPPPQLSSIAAARLEEGISLLLLQWSSLRMAVDNEWGGPQFAQKAHQLVASIFAWFTQSKGLLYLDDLEDMLDEAMITKFNSEIDDGSIGEVAEKLMIIHEECMKDNFKSIENLREKHSRRGPVSHVRQVPSDDEDDNDDNDSDSNDDASMGNDVSSKMSVDVPQEGSNVNPVSMQVDQERPTASAEVDDGWVVVGPRRNRGQRK